MPPFKDAIVTRDFMLGVKNGFYWCMRPEYVRTLKVCADPPSKAVLATMLAKIMLTYPNLEQSLSDSVHHTAHLIVKKPPSVHWQIMVLS